MDISEIYIERDIYIYMDRVWGWRKGRMRPSRWQGVGSFFFANRRRGRQSKEAGWWYRRRAAHTAIARKTKEQAEILTNW